MLKEIIKGHTSTGKRKIPPDQQRGMRARMWEDTWMTKRTKASQVYREDQGYFHSSPTTLASRKLADSWVS